MGKENLQACLKQYEAMKKAGLNLDLTRGKPSVNQLDMVQTYMEKAMAMGIVQEDEGIDIRNYGGLSGLPAMRKIVGEMVGVDPEKVMTMGNSSLRVMHSVLSFAMVYGLPGQTPWDHVKEKKWLCPSPGYDRHFNMTEKLGFDLVTVDMTPDGPDMDQVRELAKDPSVKGIWCVPKFSNPDGYVYSEETCRALAEMEAADDFLILWDNAYAVHYLYEDEDLPQIPDILSLCEEAGHPNRVMALASTSKMSFPGSGVSSLAGNLPMLDWFRACFANSSIGPNKFNQMIHVNFFRQVGGVDALMRMHADVIRPKFHLVEKILKEELEEEGLARWNLPKGGYFLSVYLKEGTAKRVYDLCLDAGLQLTQPGATYPYHKDPRDWNLRLSITVPPLEDLQKAMELFCLCVKIAAYEGE